MQITKRTSPSKQQPQSAISSLVKKEDLVRLMLQSLIDLGYNEAAECLQRESGFTLESDLIVRLRTYILGGQWQLAEDLLPNIPFTNVENLSTVQFLIRQQKFLELLEEGEAMQALHVLRTEITPLGENTQRLHLLTSLVLCSSIEDVMEQASWDGTKRPNSTSRQQLLNDIQHYVDPTAMIPKQRLFQLIHQAVEYQKRSCLYHNPTDDCDISLFSDHLCDKALFPTKTIKILTGHTDEIWHVAYSHDGKHLASVSKDKTCIIWDMDTFEKVQSFVNEESGSYCSWSPDDTKLLICGIDFAIRLWDPFLGILLQTFAFHKDQVTSCAWLPDSEHFISGACEKILCLWHCQQSHVQPVTQWPVQRTTDMKITADGSRLVTIGMDKCINVYDLEDLQLTEIARLEEEGTITSLTLTKNGRYALVNVQELQELHLWDLETRQIVHKYAGQKQLTFIIRSTLGGRNDSFVISGSEDNRVYIWSREHETLLEELEGHENTVNCISWRPIEPIQFVSASDDQTIRVWGSPQHTIASSQ
ncbi:WD40-repeat-containing domain protein [Mycotypha africana]|uniref:WD40-repeat-containing domain protein n=1 Tax=Mycotypha africana TaxID=64632 RepID=UPI0023002B8E|nr:WD40-repeat-containing domain protein [Mycotypha africana]KAI8971693.1 WD40-repeat-containing domain protein [Mycotypha africana]